MTYSVVISYYYENTVTRIDGIPLSSAYKILRGETGGEVIHLDGWDHYDSKHSMIAHSQGSRGTGYISRDS